MPSRPPAVAVPPLTLRQRRKGAISLHLDVFLANYPPPLPAEERDWLDLPLDATLSILERLDPIELLVGGVAGACRSWRRSTRDEPALWRHIDMRIYPRDLVGLEEFAREAVLRSEGSCESFSGEEFGDDDFLLFLAEQAPCLRILRLDFFHKVTNEGFVEAIRKFPLLEELELRLCHGVTDPRVFELVAKVCPRMKHFRHMIYRSVSSYGRYEYDSADPDCDIEALAIAGMHQLRSLQLFHNTLTNEGLAAIINNCPDLEFLDMRSCGNIVLDQAMRAKCARIKRKIVNLRNLEYIGEDFEEGSNIDICSTCGMSEYFTNLRNLRNLREESEGTTDSDDQCDSEDQCESYCYYLDDEDETNLEEHGRMMFGKSAQRYNL